jgi:hypothetical protein
LLWLYIQQLVRNQCLSDGTKGDENIAEQQEIQNRFKKATYPEFHRNNFIGCNKI